MDRNFHRKFKRGYPYGQARKSLWIETEAFTAENRHGAGQARTSLWIETGSTNPPVHWGKGQARKSLWIETITLMQIPAANPGQARKSLWIETLRGWISGYLSGVRLVRACGSKPVDIYTYYKHKKGQARKSQIGRASCRERV